MRKLPENLEQRLRCPMSRRATMVHIRGETRTGGSSTSTATKAPTSLTRVTLSTTSHCTNSATSLDSTTRRRSRTPSSWTTAELTIPTRSIRSRMTTSEVCRTSTAAIQAVPCHRRKVMGTKRMRNPGNPPARCAVRLSAEEPSAVRWSTRRLSARATTASSSPGHVKPRARRTRIKESLGDATVASTPLDHVVAPIWEAHSSSLHREP